MSDYVLEMKNISKYYGGIVALDNVNLSLKKGEVLCLVGENGAGKSTLMKILLGIEEASTGQIFLENQRVQIRSPQDAFDLGISMVHQELIQVEEMSVAENIFMGRYKSKYGFINSRDLEKRTEKLMERLGIYFEPNSLVKHYSIADKQLIEIVKALSYDSSIIVFDEPTAALTLDETETLYKTIHHLKETGISIIFISHRMKDIFELGDRIVVLRDGELTGISNIQDVEIHDIVNMMIGREVTQQFPNKTNSKGKKILEIRELSNSNIRNISFDLYEGEILGIAGLIGAGRTELLNAIYGIDKSEGNIIFMNENYFKRSPVESIKKGIALLPEDRRQKGLILDHSIKSNIVLSIYDEINKKGFVNAKKEKSIAETYSDNLNIRRTNVQMPVRMLSGGNQQKVVLGKCLAINPKILLLDEPTRGVDVGAKAEIYKIINELATEGLSIIVVSSDMNELLGISDRIIVMHEGYISGELNIKDASEEKIMKLAIKH